MIESRQSWDSTFCLSDQDVISELNFWKQNVHSLNRKKFLVIKREIFPMTDEREIILPVTLTQLLALTKGRLEKTELILSIKSLTLSS
jgi:hypothetical protein